MDPDSESEQIIEPTIFMSHVQEAGFGVLWTQQRCVGNVSTLDAAGLRDEKGKGGTVGLAPQPGRDSGQKETGPCVWRRGAQERKASEMKEQIPICITRIRRDNFFVAMKEWNIRRDLCVHTVAKFFL